jgi:hypothetical protein
MKIIVDEEGKKAITELCHIALRAGGINNLNEINQILTSVKEYKEEKKEDVKRD